MKEKNTDLQNLDTFVDEKTYMKIYNIDKLDGYDLYNYFLYNLLVLNLDYDQFYLLSKTFKEFVDKNNDKEINAFKRYTLTYNIIDKKYINVVNKLFNENMDIDQFRKLDLQDFIHLLQKAIKNYKINFNRLKINKDTKNYTPHSIFKSFKDEDQLPKKLMSLYPELFDNLDTAVSFILKFGKDKVSRFIYQIENGKPIDNDLLIIVNGINALKNYLDELYSPNENVDEYNTNKNINKITNEGLDPKKLNIQNQTDKTYENTTYEINKNELQLNLKDTTNESENKDKPRSEIKINYHRAYLETDVEAYIVKLLKDNYKPVNVVKSGDRYLMRLKHVDNGLVKIVDVTDHNFYFYVLQEHLKSLENYLPFQDLNKLDRISISIRDIIKNGREILYDFYNPKVDTENTPEPKEVVEYLIKTGKPLNDNPQTLTDIDYSKLKYAYETDINIRDFLMLYTYSLIDFDYFDPSKLNVAYYDIEALVPQNVSLKDNYGKYPVSAITLIDDKYVYIFTNLEIFKNSNIDENLLRNNILTGFNKVKESFKDKFPLNQEIVIKIFPSEKEMIRSFFTFTNENFELLGAWNVFFDSGYLAKRWLHLNNDDPFITGDLRVYETGYSGKSSVNKTRTWNWGTVENFDLLDEYRSVENLENYKLNSAAKKELGFEKVSFEGLLEDLHVSNTEKFFEYNIQDTYLIYLIDKIKGFSDLIKAQSCAAHTSIQTTLTSTLGAIDALLYKFARLNNKAVRNKLNLYKNFKKIGAYVRDPNPLRESVQGVICLDVASMYPNVIRSYNISPDTMVCLIDTGTIKNETDIDKVDLEDRFFALMDVLITGIENEFFKPDDKIPVIFNPYTTRDRKLIKIKELSSIIKENNYILTARGCVFKHPDDQTGIFAQIAEYLLNTRSVYKKLYSETKLDKYKLLSTGIKILNNSLYGALGNIAFRFSNNYLVESVTLTSQMFIKLSALSANSFIEEYLEVA